MKKQVKWIMAGIMLVTFFLMYMLSFEHIIIYHEQHHLFRFSSEWIAESAHQYGFWHPWTEFIVQFGYWIWLGALIWSLMFVGVYLMSQSIIRRLTGLHDLIQPNSGTDGSARDRLPGQTGSGGHRRTPLVTGLAAADRRERYRPVRRSDKQGKNRAPRLPAARRGGCLTVA